MTVGYVKDRWGTIGLWTGSILAASISVIELANVLIQVMYNWFAFDWLKPGPALSGTSKFFSFLNMQFSSLAGLLHVRLPGAEISLLDGSKNLAF